MYCSSCGKKIANTSKFCPFCGDKIANIPAGENGFNNEAAFSSTGLKSGFGQGQAFQGFRKPRGFDEEQSKPYENVSFERFTNPEAKMETEAYRDNSNTRESIYSFINKAKEKLVWIKSRMQRILVGRSAIVAAIAAIIVFVFVFSFISRRMVNEPCDWCNRRPTMAFKVSDGSMSYVCSECRKKCNWCGKRATRHYENMAGMMVFVCDDCYKEANDD